jgi:uncharacterized RDD family membrane protein YckC
VEEIVTGEAVILDLPYARFPTRMLAWLLDMLVEIVILVVILILVGVGLATKVLNNASGTAVFIAGLVLVIVGYPVACETLSRGRSVGKLALGLRVVADDGGPERFRHALVRALAGAIECWSLIGVPALITAMVSARGKRLGDVFAGTFVVRERAPKAATPFALQDGAYPGGFPRAGRPSYAAAAYITPSLQSWAAALELSAVPEPLAASAASYLSRFWQLNETARDQLGRQLAADLAARVSPLPPAGLSPADYLYTVLAERRNRELARLAPPTGHQPAGHQPAPGGAPWPQPLAVVPPSPAPPPAAAYSPAPPPGTAYSPTPPPAPAYPPPPAAGHPAQPPAARHPTTPSAPGHHTAPSAPGHTAPPQEPTFTPPV